MFVKSWSRMRNKRGHYMWKLRTKLQEVVIFPGKRGGWCRHPMEKLQCDLLLKFDNNHVIDGRGKTPILGLHVQCSSCNPKLTSGFVSFIAQPPPQKAFPDYTVPPSSVTQPCSLLCHRTCSDSVQTPELLVFTCLSISSSGPKVKTHVSEGLPRDGSFIT